MVAPRTHSADTIMWANAALLHYFGYTMDELLQQNIRVLMPAQGPPPPGSSIGGPCECHGLPSSRPAIVLAFLGDP